MSFWRELLGEFGVAIVARETALFITMVFSTGVALIYKLVSEKDHVLNVLLEDLHMSKEFIDD